MDSLPRVGPAGGGSHAVNTGTLVALLQFGQLTVSPARFGFTANFLSQESHLTCIGALGMCRASSSLGMSGFCQVHSLTVTIFYCSHCTL